MPVIRESKVSESKDGSDDSLVEEDVHFSEEILSAAVVFCSSRAFEGPVTNFKLQHVHVFTEYVKESGESKSERGGSDVEEVEQSLQCTQVFELYQELVEELLTDFTANRGCNVEEFFRECADAVAGKFVPLFEEHENKWWAIARQSVNLFPHSSCTF